MAADLRMKMLQRHKNVPFVDRILNPQNYPRPTIFDGKNRQTHFMAAEYDRDGNAFMFPMIILKDGEYAKFRDPRKALEYNKSIGNVIPFGKDIKKADEFSRNYKPDRFKKYYEAMEGLEKLRLPAHVKERSNAER